jgi:flagellar hook-associated protein 2
MSITFNGLATGIDTDSIVTKMMDIERMPITRLEAKKKQSTERLEAYAQFKTTLDDLKSAVSGISLTSQVKSTSVSLSAGAPFTATSSNASSGDFQVAVAKLAQTQKTLIGKDATKTGLASQSDALLGAGTFTLTRVGSPSVPTTITVDDSNNSLQGLASAINNKSAVTGVKASIINDGSANPYHLVLSGTDSSTTFTISSSLTSGGNPVDFGSSATQTQAQTAQQAEAYIDGLKVVSNNNTITKAISGVTLNLNAVSAADTTKTPPYATSLLEIKPDTSALKEKLTKFVSSYNKTMEWILSGYEEFGGSKTKSDTDSDTETENKELLGSVLRGDSTIQSIKRGLQSVLSSVVNNSGSLHVLSEMGITTQLDGTLLQNNSKLDNALANNFDGVVKLLAGEDSSDGVMKKFNYYLVGQTSSATGMYANKKANYKLNIARIDSQIRNMEPRIAKKEAMLRAQYTAMEQMVSGLNAQGSYLTQQMDMLNNMIKG